MYVPSQTKTEKLQPLSHQQLGHPFEHKRAFVFRTLALDYTVDRNTII